MPLRCPKCKKTHTSQTPCPVKRPKLVQDFHAEAEARVNVDAPNTDAVDAAKDPSAPPVQTDGRVELRSQIQAAVKRMGELRVEIDDIAHTHIPHFHFMSSAVSYDWTCDKSPIGMCVFKLSDIDGRPLCCRYCGGFVERK